MKPCDKCGLEVDCSHRVSKEMKSAFHKGVLETLEWINSVVEKEVKDLENRTKKSEEK